ncbi:A.superbus venom factor 1-like [Mantella aurantiaca]
MGCRALCLVLLGFLAGSTYAQSCTLITSNVLRVDSVETFLVDGHGTAFDGDIRIQDFPKKKFLIAQGTISVNRDNEFLGTTKFLVPSTSMDKDPKKKQFVYVTVNAGPCNVEKVVLVSYQSGYMFIQTDKPIYTPGSQVLIRVYSMTPDLKPINKPVIIEILTPDNVIVMKDALQQYNIKGIIPYGYRLNDLARTLPPVGETGVHHYMVYIIGGRLSRRDSWLPMVEEDQDGGTGSGMLHIIRESQQDNAGSAEQPVTEQKKEKQQTDAFISLFSLSSKRFGVWTVAARFEEADTHNYTTNFEVKEYVLPSFEVKITVERRFYYIRDEEFKVELDANFLYGKPVDGMAYVIFSVTRDVEKKSLPDTLRRIPILDGKGLTALRREDIVKYFQQEMDMLQWKLSVSATVFTDSGSDMVETELTDIHMVTSPYKILFTKTSKYFKPGIPMDLMVFVINPDGSPAQRVPVVMKPGTVKGVTQTDGTVRLSINTFATINSLEITKAPAALDPDSQEALENKVTTADPGLLPSQQANASMTATAYQPVGGNYLHLDIGNVDVKIGGNVAIKFNIQNANPTILNNITQFNYIVLNKGRIMRTGSQKRSPGQSLVISLLQITPEFIPSFRILAYYVVSNRGKHEIVADSIWIDVEDTCMGTLTVSGEQEQDNKVHPPGVPMKLRVKADHMASVGLVAVDRGVYVLNDKYKISQTKVWNSVEKYDTGCTAGGGADAAGVFYDAGLALGNNFHGSTPQRSEPLCQVKFKRRRRDTAALIQTKNTKASNYEGLEKTCCEDGMRDLPMKVSCERRSRNIAEGEKCINAFLDCCRHMEKIREAEAAKDQYARSDEDDDYIADSDITTRTDFPESWLWRIETMNEKPDANGISSKSLSILLRDSITTWEVLAVSLSENKGICVSNPYNIQVMMSFFIDLRLPYAVVRNEQVEIRAILYNYGNSDIKVRVQWTYNEEFCSLSTAKSKYRQTVTVKAASSLAIPYIIIPLTLGEHKVEVKAAGQLDSDGVMKMLKVVPEGRRVVQTLLNVVLDPEARGRAGVQEEFIKTVDLKNIVPKAKVETFITVQGTAVSQLVERAIDGANLNHLIIAPHGCGEQIMIRMTPTVIATHYLDTTGQWEKIGVDRRTEAIQHMKNGLTTQLTFRKEDASYGAWIDRESSTWLTAYVVKVFALAQEFISIGKDVLCDSVKWLILKQKPNGLFVENHPIYHQDMAGGITEKAVELDSTLTAFVLIAMLESNTSCSGYVDNLQFGIDRAIKYLQQQYPNVRTPYTIAIASYALAKAGKLENIDKLMSACTDDSNWQEPGSNHLSLEASSYGLLTLVMMKEYDKAGPVVQWLTEQRFHGQVWGATQSTIMIFQSIAQYYIDVPIHKDLDMDVDYTFPGRTAGTKIRLHRKSALIGRTEQTENVGNFKVIATGKGKGALSVFSVYYALETETEKQCNNFSLSLKVQDEPLAKGPEGTISTVSLTICTKYLKSQDSGMSILQISMMTGFAADTNDLNKLKKGVDRYISNFEINKGAYDQSTVVLYIDKISHTEDMCLKFNLHQYFKMGLIQPASVTVYDYYSPENRCTKFYHVDENSKLLGKICLGEVCRCAEQNCFMQQRLEKVNANVRLTRACENVDYVYKMTLKEIQEKNNYFTYLMNITLVIKPGTDQVQVAQKRNFISHAKCHAALNLQVGRSYLVWGIAKDLWKLDVEYSYMLTKDTWIEMWPNGRECQQAEYETVCDELMNFSDELHLLGCVS